jgi:ATP-binding cassette subfamily B protein
MTDAATDEDEHGERRRALSNAKVLGFIARFWLRRKGLFLAGVGLTLAAICFDLALPWASGKLIDTSPRARRPSTRPGAPGRPSSASIWASR